MQTIAVRTRIDFTGHELGMPLVDRGGYDSFSTPLGLQMHTHHGFELTYVFQGRVHWEIDGGEILTLSGRDMAVTQPGVAHRGYRNIIQPASIFWLGIAAEPATAGRGSGLTSGELDTIADALRGVGHAVRFTAGALDESLRALHDSLAVLRRGGDTGLTKAQCRTHIAGILLGAAELLRGSPASRTADSYAAAAVDFMKRSLCEPVSVHAVAAHVGMSVSRLHAVFKQRLGMTPNDYLQRLRVDSACALLSTTRMPITRIALELGFASSQYFATCFRKYVGMSPRTYRRAQMEGNR